MTKKQVQQALLALIADSGYDTVRSAFDNIRPLRTSEARVAPKRPRKKTQAKPRADKTAVVVVSSLDVPDDKRAVLMALADKYDAKDFMTSAGSVRAFLEGEGRDASHIKSRQRAVGVVFKCLAAKDTEYLEEMERGGWYGPPKTLANIARAIENYGRQRRV